MSSKADYSQWGTWLAAAQKGDDKAYGKLLRAITPLLRNFIAKRLFDKDTVEDVVQETLMGLHKMRHTYNPAQPFESWFFAIARYKLIDAMRHQKRLQSHISFTLDSPDNNLHETIAATGANTDAGRYTYDLEKAMAGLPKRQQEIVLLLKIQGFSVQEVATEMGMSPSAVKVSAHRAYKKMKVFLEE